MSGLLSQVTNEILQATEQISTRLEEGISVLATGKLPEEQQNGYGEGIDMSEDGFEMSEEELLMADSPLQGMAEGVINDIMANSAKPETLTDHIMAFKTAITWSEPFIIGLIVFQLTMFCMCLWVSNRNRSMPVRVSFLVLLGALVRSAEYINSYAAKHWQDWNITQNYFDQHGIFVSIMFCTPLLLDCLLMLILFIREAGQLLVQVKTMEMKKKMGKSKKGAKKEKKN